jgi:beta-glucosidase
MKRSDFLSDFIWGTATASYQVEGAAQEDGRGPSIWDTFCRTPGKIKNGDTGDVACDHYHRYPEDIALMKELGVSAYRLSIAWPRLFPEGRGRLNTKGLEFYERLIDALLAANITPWVTLYHWDLPQALQDQDGWENRKTVEAYVAYVEVVSKRLGDRVKHWITHNEPWVAAFLGNLLGIHAPGLKDAAKALQVSHHLLLSHGLAEPVIRANSPASSLGITLNLAPVHPASPAPEDVAAARRYDGFMNRWFLDPLFGLGYPVDMLEAYGSLVPEITQRDLETIAAPTDFLGINYYTRSVVKHNPDNFLQLEPVPFGTERTFFDWEVYPDGLREIIARVGREYHPVAIYITENGATYQDVRSGDGSVHDGARQSYLERHVAKLSQAMHEGAPLKGYFLWSLLDNFEWAEGYEKRFGITYVDFATQQRTLKQSGQWYKGFLHNLK